MQLDTIDFAIDPLHNLHEVLAEYASSGPVNKIQFAGNSIWMVSGHAEVRLVMADDEYLSAPKAYQEILGPSMGEVLATMTGARHRNNRSAVASVFFPKRMRELSETVFSEEAEKLCDVLSQSEEVDLVEAYTRPFTFNNIARLLGLPAIDVGILEGWAARIMHSYIDLSAAITACEDMGEYLAPLVSARRESPSDDVISLLVQVEVDGKGLSDEEIYAFCRNLFPAAIDTSTNLLGTALSVVLGNPELKESTKERLTLEALVQEALRWEPPLVLVPRQCVKDLELGGRHIKVGDDVRLCLTAANNDPDVFVSPRDFDLNRASGNLSFGHGEHFCLGSHMARRVVETGLEVFFRRFPAASTVEDRHPEIVGGVLRGPEAIWVRLK
jgi:cytochrome P450